MAEPFTVSVDLSRLNAQIAAIQSATGKDTATIIKDQARLFVKQVIELTPPPGLNAAAKQQGEKAIERDLMKIFTPINEDFLTAVGSQFGVSGIDHWLTLDGNKKQEIKWDRIDPTGAGMPGFHHANQDRRGRTRNLKRDGRQGSKWYSPYVVTFQDFAAYLEKIKAHVGRRKATWGKSFKALGGHLPAWIDRHTGEVQGSCTVMLNGKTPRIEMTAAAPGLLQDQRIIQSALRIRAATVARRLKHMIRSYGTDMRNKTLVKSHETETPANL